MTWYSEQFQGFFLVYKNKLTNFLGICLITTISNANANAGQRLTIYHHSEFCIDDIISHTLALCNQKANDCDVYCVTSQPICLQNYVYRPLNGLLTPRRLLSVSVTVLTDCVLIDPALAVGVAYSERYDILFCKCIMLSLHHAIAKYCIPCTSKAENKEFT